MYIVINNHREIVKQGVDEKQARQVVRDSDGTDRLTAIDSRTGLTIAGPGPVGPRRTGKTARRRQALAAA